VALGRPEKVVTTASGPEGCLKIDDGGVSRRSSQTTPTPTSWKDRMTLPGALAECGRSRRPSGDPFGIADDLRNALCELQLRA
jgi:hypothetical protein